MEGTEDLKRKARFPDHRAFRASQRKQANKDNYNRILLVLYNFTEKIRTGY